MGVARNQETVRCDELRTRQISPLTG
jgi:hypothetical protein